eukprot:58081-Pyramimonas_sp.AAC.1
MPKPLEPLLLLMPTLGGPRQKLPDVSGRAPHGERVWSERASTVRPRLPGQNAPGALYACRGPPMWDMKNDSGQNAPWPERASLVRTLQHGQNAPTSSLSLSLHWFSSVGAG